MDLSGKSFSEVYDSLLNQTISISDAKEYMNSKEAKKHINAYLYKDKINDLIPYTEQDLQTIQSIVNICQFIYNNSGEETGLSDSEYDLLYSTMIANGGGDVISAPILPGTKNIEHHKYPSLRGSLSKVYYLTREEERSNGSREYLDDWKTRMENKYFQVTGKHINLDEEEIWVFPKFDGVSGIFEYDADGNLERVLTRGFTELNEAENITLHFQSSKYRTYKLKGCKKPFGLKTEIMMMNDDLAYYNKKFHADYKQTRSIVSAIINSDEYDPEKASLLHVVPLRTYIDGEEQELAKEAFEKYPYIRCRLKDREIIRKFAQEHYFVHDGLRCDGSVIYFINPELRKLGRENEKNNWEVAYKFTEESAITTLKDINFNMGLFGRLAPVAKIKPIKLKGNTIENISIGSIGRLKSLNLNKGDTVKVLYDIIPYLAFDSDCSHIGKEKIEIPTICPECGGELEFSESGDLASCTNKDCPCRIKGRILNFLSKMNIENLSYGVIDKLYESGIVTSIKDLYRLEENKKEIIKIDGFGPKMAKLFIDSINEKREVPDYVVLGSIGIEGISKKTFQSIMELFTMDDLIEIADNNDICKLIFIRGIQDKTAVKIVTGIKENKKLLRFLENELVILRMGTMKDAKFSVCFSSYREDEKKEILKFIKEKGGIVVDSLTKDTTYLIAPAGANSSKVQKASKYNIPVYTIEDFPSAF